MSKIAVLIPCYNEVLTIGRVVDDFISVLPDADIYVYDNNSTDGSGEVASKHGAIVVKWKVQGKGAVVKQMFKEIDADIYLMVDGDGTYPALFAPLLIDRLNGYDMVIGDRLTETYSKNKERLFHKFGNKLVRFLINRKFHSDVSDIMTGYRAFTRDFVKSVQLHSDGFEVETEMTIWALKNKKRIVSVPIDYKERPRGSKSKLKTIPDGLKVLKIIFKRCV